MTAQVRPIQVWTLLKRTGHLVLENVHKSRVKNLRNTLSCLKYREAKIAKGVAMYRFGRLKFVEVPVTENLVRIELTVLDFYKIDETLR